MKIEVVWENDGQRLKLEIESISLFTHSQMQSLSAEDIEDTKEYCRDILADFTKLLNSTNERK